MKAKSLLLTKKLESDSIIKLILWTIVLCSVSVLFWLVANYADNVPYWDDFAFFHFINDFYDKPTIKRFVTVLFRQHNEHRIVLPKLIAFLDHVFFGDMSFSRLIIYSNFIILSIAVVLHGIYKNLWILSLVTLCLFIPRIELNFWALGGLPNLGVLLCSFGSIAILNQNSQKWKYIIVAFLLASLALFNLASGILSFAVGAFYLYIKERKLFSKQLVFWVIGGTLIMGFYLNDYQNPSGHPDVVSNNISQLIQLPAHSLLLTTSVFSGLISSNWIRMVMGLLIHIVIGYMIYTKRGQLLKWPVELSLFSFAMLNSWMVSVSRYGFGSLQANSERYEIISALVIITFAALAFRIFAINKKIKIIITLFFLINYLFSLKVKSDLLSSHHEAMLTAALGYEERVGDLVQFPSESAAFNWLDQSIERGLYINPLDESLNVFIDSTSTRMLPTTNVTEAWGFEVNSETKIYASGWSVIKGIPSEYFTTFFIFTNDIGSYIFSTVSSVRKDVTKHLNDGTNYNSSGFLFLVSKDKLGLSAGTYACHIMLVDSRDNKQYVGIAKDVEIYRDDITLRVIDLYKVKNGGITCAFGSNGDEIVVVEGWAFLSGEPTFKAQKEVLLRLKGSNSAYSFTPDEVYRNDVTNHINDGNNYDFSGFKISFSVQHLGIPSGSYQIGVRLKSSTQDAVVFSEEYLQIR